MKKIIACTMLIFFVCTMIFSFNMYSVEATNQNEVLKEETTSKIIELKEEELQSLEDYKAAYGSDSYGLAAFILNRVRQLFII